MIDRDMYSVIAFLVFALALATRKIIATETESELGRHRLPRAHRESFQLRPAAGNDVPEAASASDHFKLKFDLPTFPVALGLWRDRPKAQRQAHLVRKLALLPAPTPEISETSQGGGQMDRRATRNIQFWSELGPGGRELTFEERLQFAMTASLREGRVIGVIHFHIRCLEGGDPPKRDLADPGLIDVVADRFRKSLRTTDCVAILAPDEIAIFIAALSSLMDLRAIAGRLSTAALDLDPLSVRFAASDPGIAIHPIDGYSGDNLVASARARSANRRLGAGGAGLLRADPPEPKRA